MSQNATFVVTKANVQQISSYKLCSDFFSSLGFDNHSTNTFSEAELASLLRTLHPRRDFFKQGVKLFQLAQRKDITGEFTTYLYLLPTLTQTLAKHIFNDLVRLNGEFLVILADPLFKEIEIVYVDRHASAAAALQQPLPGLSDGSTKAQFRSLSFSHTSVSDKVVRVLNRFSWPVNRSVNAQRAILSSAFDVAEWSEDYFTNRALFSDYYLNSTLREKLPWKEVEHDPGFTSAWNKLKQAYEEAADELSGQPAKVLRERLLNETLRTLGFAYNTERHQRTKDGQRVPDYVLFSRQRPPRVEGQPLDKEQNRISVCLAYEWNRNLDGYSDRVDVLNEDNDDTLDLNSTDFENPGAAIVSLLDQEEQKQVNWAILTNGKIWRLYSAKAHNRATNYYELDLEDTLAISRDNPQEAKEAFRYFWLFFRAEAFVPRSYDNYKEEQPFLDYVLRESTEYALKLGNSLKKMIFDEVFAHFAGGLVDSAQKKGTLPQDFSIYDEQQQQRLLKPFFDATLTFLYRLLFLLYAESRSLLPIYEQHGYYMHSLSHMKRKLADELKNNRARAYDKLDRYKIDRYDYYEQLQTIFKAIDKGNEEWNIPVYNGGLFQTEVVERDLTGVDEEGFPLIAQATPEELLKQHQINDRALVTGLDLLTRDKDSNRADELAMIDYKSLGVRQLGSIYEGLLEFKLRIALEEMVEVKGNKIITFTEAVKSGLYKSGKTPLILRNTVYIENDQHERKTSGSYYTPDYIVEYIVAQTVGPIMDEKEEQLREKFRQQEKHFLEQARRNKQLKALHMDVERLDKSLHNQALVDEFFDIKVLDPAMGSGHFLVETVDFITRRMLAFLNRIPLNPVTKALNAIRTDIQTEMESQNVFIDRNKLTDINLLKRQILKRCVYGVDLNPMAVELAKVSVWLDSFTVGAPLSFLDHHLKCGNSLVGANVEDARKTIKTGQQTLFFGNNVWAGVLLSTQGMIRISKLTDVTPIQARESKKEFVKAELEIMPYKQLLNVYLSRWFSNPVKINKEKYQVDKALNFIHSDEAQAWVEKAGAIEFKEEQKTVLNNANYDTETYKFFHWELEFPEVFIDPNNADFKKNAGFDAIVGNPPYDILADKERNEDLTLLKEYFNHRLVFKPAIGKKLDFYRLFLIMGLELTKRKGYQGQIIPLSLLGDQQVTSLRKHLLSNCRFVNIEAFPQKDDPKRRVFKEAKLATSVIIVVNDSSETKPFLVTTHPGKLLEEISGYYKAHALDIKEFDSKNFIIPTLKSISALQLAKKLSSDSRFIPFSKLIQTFQGEINETTMDYLISDSYLDGPQILRGGNIQRYSFLNQPKQGEKKHIKLEQYKKQIKGNKASHTTMQRIGYQRNAALDNWRRLIFGLLPNPCYCFDSISYFIVSGETSYYYLALLNSSLLEWRFNLTSSNNHVSTEEVGSLPIPRINFANSEHLREYHMRQAQKLYENYISNPGNQQNILDAVKQHLAKEPEESDVVHDLLAMLAEDMLRLNYEKRALQQEFLNWLVEYLHIQTQPDSKSGKVGIDALTHKSDLLNYPGDYQKGEDMLDVGALEHILEENKKRYLVPWTSSRWLEIQDHYRASLDKVFPIKNRLKQTDDLIDQVVYKLYGLTEDEIRVVEGTAQ